jgi:predicted PurR-regulated permease PerM
VLGPIATVGLSAATIIGGLAVAIVTAYYIAAQPDPLTNAITSLFPTSRQLDVQRVMERLRQAWIGWLRGLGASMAIIGILLYLCLQLIVGLPFALTFAVLGGLAEVVPYLGALASGIIPTAFALTISPGTAIAVVVIYIVVHQVEANLIGPLVMSRAVHMHPAAIAVGVIAVGEVFGFLGLIVAVPILSTIWILAEELWVRPQEQQEALRGASPDELVGPPEPRRAGMSAP